MVLVRFGGFERQNIWVTWRENLLMNKDVHARKWRRKKPREELSRERDVRFTGEVSLVAKEAWRNVCKGVYYLPSEAVRTEHSLLKDLRFFP
ncbi:hypothetical protein EK904_011653 [Melospiza melodia maxima]|nr:hypothetical protein EK904_011653 [Melospiza melodia maxima]